MNIFRYRIFAFGFAALFGADAHAAVFSVGTGPGCTHGTIQAAIDAANTSAGADTVRLTRSLTYEPEADTIVLRMSSPLQWRARYLSKRADRMIGCLKVA